MEKHAIIYPTRSKLKNKEKRPDLFKKLKEERKKDKILNRGVLANFQNPICESYDKSINQSMRSNGF